MNNKDRKMKIRIDSRSMWLGSEYPVVYGGDRRNAAIAVVEANHGQVELSFFFWLRSVALGSKMTCGNFAMCWVKESRTKAKLYPTNVRVMKP